MNSLLLSKSYFAMDCDVSPDRGSDQTILLATHEIVSSDDYQSSPDSILHHHDHHHHHHHHHHHQLHNYSLHPQSISNDDEDDDDIIFDMDQPPPLLQVEETRDPLALDDNTDELLRLDSPPKLDKHPPLSLQQNVPRIRTTPVRTAAAAAATAVRSSNNLEKVGTASDSVTAMGATKPRKAAATMREVLAAIPGFSVKPRRRSSKKMSTAAQIEQTKSGKIDLETPDSILVSTNLRALLNKQTFSLLPPLFQHSLVQLLPNVDRPPPNETEPGGTVRLNSSTLNNEFFARACLDWRERLATGELTPENQNKLKTEAEREMSKLDPWKLKHFEPIWGDKSYRAKKISDTSDERLNAVDMTTINKSESGTESLPPPLVPISSPSSSDAPSTSTRTSVSPSRSTSTAFSLPSDNTDTVDYNRMETIAEQPTEILPSQDETDICAIAESVEDVDEIMMSSPKLIESADEENFDQQSIGELSEIADIGDVSEKEPTSDELKYMHDSSSVMYEVEVDTIDTNESSQSDDIALDMRRAEKRASSPDERDSKQMKLSESVDWEDIECPPSVERHMEELIPDGEIPMTAAEMEVISTITSNSTNSLSDCSNQSISEIDGDHRKEITLSDLDDNVMPDMDDNITLDESSLPPSPLLESIVYTDPGSPLDPSTKCEEDNEIVIGASMEESLPLSTYSYADLAASPQLFPPTVTVASHRLQTTDKLSGFLTESQRKTVKLNEIIEQISARIETVPKTKQLTTTSATVCSSPAIYRLSLAPSTQLKVISTTNDSVGIESGAKAQTTIIKTPIYTSVITTTAAQNAAASAANALAAANGRGRKTISKLPPGAVNLERSYQICQAVIQNSPNRNQLKAQLKPPPFIVNTNINHFPANSNPTILSTTPAFKLENQFQTTAPPVVYKVITAPRLGFPRKKIVHRQFTAPTVVRQLYTTGVTNFSGTTTTTVPLRIQQSAVSITPAQSHQTQLQQSQQQPPQQQQQSGQYVLIQRANVTAAESVLPRASSAPPQPPNQQTIGVNGLLSMTSCTSRMRPASVDAVLSNEVKVTTKKLADDGLTYDTISIDSNHLTQNSNHHYHHHQQQQQNFTTKRASGENTPPNCSCSLNAMVVCQKCGAYCQHDCISSSKLCVSCTIR